MDNNAMENTINEINASKHNSYVLFHCDKHHDFTEDVIKKNYSSVIRELRNKRGEMATTGTVKLC